MKLVVCFGGLGYHCDRPLLYYGRRLAMQHGYDRTATIEYEISVNNIMGNPEKMEQAFREAFSQAEEQLGAIEFNQYDEILFLSKSIGTIVAAAYQEKYRNVFKDTKVKNVYLTPLEATFLFHPQKGIAFSGANDPWISLTAVKEECEQSDVDLTVIADGNHSLEGEDVLENLNILKNVMKKIEEYLV